MFDSNAMHELQHIKADRYQRNGGGGAHKVYVTSKAYFDARGHKDLSTWDRALIECNYLWRQAAAGAKADFRLDCLMSKEGYYNGEDVPF